MKLQDYAHYYIGCRCFNTWFPESHPEYNNNWILCGYNKAAGKPYHLENKEEETRTNSAKLILHRIEDCPFEIGEMRLIRDSITYRILKYAAVTKYLTDKHIDVFGLIKSGLAIDYKTIK